MIKHQKQELRFSAFLLSKISNIKGNHRDKFASNGLDSFVDNYHKNNENLLTNLGQYV